ncbi:prolipoprotein diacylglyceryl transferase [Aquibacillus salsiterrae]|uniref:Phosphatidylglycerol--prolipoprotein diacylglyceryl transferase n=1 Tax=Aquibacillus salsiterrae TaxID=2950439 RepID=A0A9X3WIM1_9BACI|nr:prolipoprotein diacylglyceryl transferase [Aquibacillus salsiterrae]MDC3418139.1 prolipoprotein diacylglyceryl transferase [Aquibacillus salsiterrae]
MKPLISIGPFSLYFFGLMIAIGAITGLILLINEAKRRNMDHKLLTDGVMYALIGGILGARLVFIFVYNPSYYLANPVEVFFIQNGGLSIHGGILGGLLVGYLFMKKHKLPIFETLDVVAPSLILAQGISRIGCDVFGGPISSALPWGMEKGGEYLHPAQAYEFILDYALFGYLWLRLKSKKYHGQVFIHYLIGFLAIRGIVEFARINPMVIGPFSVSHVMSIIGIAFAIILMNYRKKAGSITKTQPVSKQDIVKTTIIVLTLIIVSLLLYYGVQG